MHSRRKLRDAAKAALETIPAVAGKVGGVRGYAYATSGLPALEVSTPASADEKISDDGDLRRTVNLEVRIVVAASGDIEDAADDLAEPVEAAIYGLAGEWDAAILGMSSDFDAGDAREKRNASLITSFTLRWFPTEEDPQAT